MEAGIVAHSVSRRPDARRFVVLRHARGDDVHWDLMIEEAGRLATWRMDRPPGGAGGVYGLVRIPDHPLRFLDYVGPVQGGTGRVERVDEGVCKTNTEAVTAGGAVEFCGREMLGRFVLRPLGGDGWGLEPAADTSD